LGPGAERKQHLCPRGVGCPTPLSLL